MPTLFDPIKIGDLELSNRIIMAPLTRCRAEPGRVPGDLMVEYYSQRADAGLIISEATSVTPMGVGYPDTPGIWSAEQVQGWKKITEAVHAKGGKIVRETKDGKSICAIWNSGKCSEPCPNKRFQRAILLQYDSIMLLLKCFGSSTVFSFKTSLRATAWIMKLWPHSERLHWT